MIDTLINAMVAGFAATLQPLRVAVAKHAGKFTWDELQARSYSAPAVFVSCLGWRELTDDEATKQGLPVGEYSPARVRFVAGVVTRHAKGAEERNVQARLICQLIAQSLNRNDWQLDLVGVANDIRVEALFVPRAEADNQSLWLVSWWHPVSLDDAAATQALADFITAHGENYTAPGNHVDADSNDLPVSSQTETLPQ